MKRVLYGIILSLLMVSQAFGAFSIKYDIYFKRWGEYYFPFLDWRWFKAQAIQESLLNKDAVSYVGAVGLMQIMPATYFHLTGKRDYAELFDPEINIELGIKYDYQIAKTWRRWFPCLNYLEKLKFIFASYNAGSGHILKAWKLAGKSCRWEDVKKKLPKVTGRFSKETITYVSRIWMIYWTRLR